MMTDVQRTVYSSGSLSVDFSSRAVACGPGLLAVPCTGKEDVWHQGGHLRDGRPRAVPYYRLSIVVLSTYTFNLIQQALLDKVRFVTDIVVIASSLSDCCRP